MSFQLSQSLPTLSILALMAQDPENRHWLNVYCDDQSRPEYYFSDCRYQNVAKIVHFLFVQPNLIAL